MSEVKTKSTKTKTKSSGTARSSVSRHRHRMNCTCASTFRALRVFEEEGQYVTKLVDIKVHTLPSSEVLVRVKYSSLNYKDALSASGYRGFTRNYPHTLGIDAAGVVEDSSVKKIKPGEQVIVTSFDLGINCDGGLAQYICVPADWIVPLPKGMTLKTAMMFGSAGLAAAWAVQRLIDGGQSPKEGPVLVTGAAGGVGTIASLLLMKEKFDVIAATSNINDSKEYIERLGVARHIDRRITNDKAVGMLMRTMWSGAIDTVGGHVLNMTLKACKRGGNIATCGTLLSNDLSFSLASFISKDITLHGIDTQTMPIKIRRKLWLKLAKEWKLNALKDFVEECSLVDAPRYLEEIKSKKGRGRVLVKVS